jgi:hypothetical protein
MLEVREPRSAYGRNDNQVGAYLGRHGAAEASRA